MMSFAVDYFDDLSGAAKRAAAFFAFCRGRTRVCARHAIDAALLMPLMPPPAFRHADAFA